MQTLGKIPFTLLMALLCFSQFLDAQTTDSTRYFNRIAAISSSSPDAFGKGYFGTIGIGGTLQHHSRLGIKFDPDGNIISAIGLGNPEKYIGIDLRVNIFGFGNVGGRPDNLGEGSLDLHLSRMLHRNLWIGAGTYNMVHWIADGPNKLQSYYASTTAIFHLKENNRKAFSTLFLTAGVGNGKFRTDGDYTLAKPGPIGAFGAVALQVFPEGNFIAEWTGYNVFSGFSIMPSKDLPWQVLVGADDIFHKKRHLIIATSFGFHLFKDSYNTHARMAILPPPPPPQSSRI